MSLRSRLASGLRALLGTSRSERDLDDELRAYLDAAVDRKTAAGATPEAAARAARAEIGSVEAIKDRVRDVGWEAHVDTLLRDIRFGIRSFLRTPRFTLPALLTLSLGIGVTAAMFSVIRTVLLEPLPYRDPERLVTVWETTRGGASRNSIAPANFVAWRERSRTLEHLGMVGPRGAVLLVNGQPLQSNGAVASAAVFAALGVQPALGRAHTVEEDASTAVVILGYEFWQRVLSGRPDVLGMALAMDGAPRTVIGVMPARFTILGQNADFLVPYGLTTEQLQAEPGRGSSYALARRRPGVEFAAASDEMRAIYAALEKEQPQRNAGRTVMVFRPHDQMVGDVRAALVTLAAAVVLVLIVACVNVASLHLARSASRAREMGMRTALGAGRARLIQQTLTESVVLAAAGGIAGLAVAALLHRGLVLAVSGRLPIPRLDQVTLDLTVVAFAMLVALAAGIGFGIAPALLSANAAGAALREGGRHIGGRRLRRALDALVVAEVAMSVVLLAGAGLLLRSFVNLSRIDTGFRIDDVLTAGIQLPRARYDPAKAAALVEEALARTAALPGVRAAAAATCLPPPGSCTATSIWRLDRSAPLPGDRRSGQVRPVTPGFFQTMGIPLVSGRDFAATDGATSAAAIVSETLVRSHFDGESPLGRTLHINTVPHANGRDDMEWTVVGVVRDIRSSSDATAAPIAYVPLAQMPARNARLFVRAENDAAPLGAVVARVVRSLEPETPVDVRTLEDIVGATIARPRATTTLAGAFALLALTLAAIGVYGVIAYSVRERTQEIGVRLALGATAGNIGRLVLGQAMRLALSGAAAGMIAAGALTGSLERLLFGVSPVDPWTFAGAPLAFLIVAAAAAYLPARRGMRLAPADVLRRS